MKKGVDNLSPLWYNSNIKRKGSVIITMTVKELRAVLTLVKNENAEISFSTEPGVAFDVNGFEDDGEDFWILLDTLEWRKQG